MNLQYSNVAFLNFYGPGDDARRGAGWFPSVVRRRPFGADLVASRSPIVIAHSTDESDPPATR
jgi:hypothetical protein